MVQNIQPPKISKTLAEKIKKIEYKLHVYTQVCNEFDLDFDLDSTLGALWEKVIDILINIIKDDFIGLILEIDERSITDKQKQVLYKNLIKEFPIETRIFLKYIQEEYV